MSFASLPAQPNNFCEITPFVGGLETASLYVSALHLLTGVISFWRTEKLAADNLFQYSRFYWNKGDL